MANAFDIDKVLDKNGVDQNVDTHLLNETFHVFSKSPASPSTTLGGARLKSGHTTTASDVWADEIPAFFNAATQAKFELFQTKAVKDDLCLYNGEVYQHNGTSFTSLGAADVVLVDGATFSKNGKPVIKYHRERPAINLTPDNNNGDGADNLAAKIYNAAEGSTTFVPQFISSTDKMVDGIPSLAYDAAVFAGGSQLAEGLTADNDYICNAYAGVIQFNKARSSGVTVSAWEYIGDKLNSTVAALKAAVFGDNDSPDAPDLSLTEQVNANTTAINTLKGADTVSGSVAHSIKTAIDSLDSTSNGSNGISVVQTDGLVSTTITVAAVDSNGTVTSGQTNVVTAAGAQNIAKAAATAAITDALKDTEDSAITKKIESEIADATLADDQTIAETTATDKLVTVEDVKTYVEENAKVTLNQGTGITISPNATASTTFTISVDDSIATTDDVATAKSEAIDAAKTETESQVGAAKNELTIAIGTAKDQAIAAAKSETESQVAALKSELTTGEGSLGKKVEALEGEVSTIKTTTIPTAKSEAIAAAKTETETQVAALKKTLEEGAIKDAQDAADAAQAAADAAQKDATQALTNAATAQAAAEAAQGTANTAVTNAAAAQKAADDAQKDATQALADAATAQAAAEAAQADADALETRMTTAEGAITATTEIISDLKKVSLAKESADGLVKVSTTGTIGTGLESISVTVSDTIVETTDALSATSTGSANVEVKLSGTVAQPVLTVKGTDIASAADLTALTTKVDTHIAGAAKLSIVVVSADSNGQPVVEAPETNKLYLVAGQGAESGTYVEWIYLEGGTWERIGTTATDLSEYAKTADVTPLITAAQTQADKGVADAATAKAAADKAQKAADDAQTDVDALEKLVGTTSVGSQIDTKLSALTDTTAQGGAGVSLTQTNGRVALTVTSGAVAASGTTGADKFVKGETVHTAITTAEAAAKKHADDAIAALDATKESAGVKVVQTNGAITEVTVTPGSVAANDASVVTGGAVYTAIKAVSDLVGTTAVATQISDAIAALDSEKSGNGITVTLTDGKVTGVAAAAGTVAEGNTDVVTGGVVHTAVEGVKAIAEAKISAVQNDSDYFGSPLVTTDGTTVTVSPTTDWYARDFGSFSDLAIKTIIGNEMTTVGGNRYIIDTANLVDATDMFKGCTTLETVIADFDKLHTADGMFEGCTNLTTFCGNLGSLVHGSNMFKGCTLSEESLIYIVDSLYPWQDQDGVPKPQIHLGNISQDAVYLVNEVINTEANGGKNRSAQYDVIA